MEVTRHNWLATISQLEDIINDSTFVAIDTELCGLRRLDTKSSHLLDTADQRYRKLRDSIAGFGIIQFGLTAVKSIISDGHQRSYVCHSYNFYIFPQKSSRFTKSMGDRVMSVQTSSLQFLASNGFDFNKLIIDGISYLNQSEEQILLDTIDAQKSTKTNEKSSPAPSAVTEEDKQFIGEVMTKVNEFLADNDRQTIDLSPCNAFRRRLIYEALKSEDFSDSLDMKTVLVSNTSSDRYVSITKVDKLEKQRQDEDQLTEAIGFSKVIQLLIKYQKPIVGHNVLLDLLHTFNQFVEPLPEDYETFKDLIHSLFPIVYDTKHLSSAPVFKQIPVENTALGDLHERLKTSPFKPINIELKNGKYSDGKALHEAGYDSYITSVCFIGLTHYLTDLLSPNISPFDVIVLSDYRNKLFLTYSHDIHYLDLESDQLTPNRDHVFYVTFPKEWKTNELFHLFSAFGGVSIGWINDTSALCALKDASNADKIRKSLLKQSTKTYKVISYNDFVDKSTDDDDNTRDNVKRQSKVIASPQTTPNPYKKSKVIEDKTSDGNQIATKESKHKPKLFEEPIDWEAETK